MVRAEAAAFDERVLGAQLRVARAAGVHRLDAVLVAEREPLAHQFHYSLARALDAALPMRLDERVLRVELELWTPDADAADSDQHYTFALDAARAVCACGRVACVPSAASGSPFGSPFEVVFEVAQSAFGELTLRDARVLYVDELGAYERDWTLALNVFALRGPGETGPAPAHEQQQQQQLPGVRRLGSTPAMPLAKHDSRAPRTVTWSSTHVIELHERTSDQRMRAAQAAADLGLERARVAAHAAAMRADAAPAPTQPRNRRRHSEAFASDDGLPPLPAVVNAESLLATHLDRDAVAPPSAREAVPRPGTPPAQSTRRILAAADARFASSDAAAPGLGLADSSDDDDDADDSDDSDRAPSPPAQAAAASAPGPVFAARLRYQRRHSEAGDDAVRTPDDGDDDDDDDDDDDVRSVGSRRASSLDDDTLRAYASLLPPQVSELDPYAVELDTYHASDATLQLPAYLEPAWVKVHVVLQRGFRSKSRFVDDVTRQEVIEARGAPIVHWLHTSLPGAAGALIGMSRDAVVRYDVAYDAEAEMHVIREVVVEVQRSA